MYQSKVIRMVSWSTSFSFLLSCSPFFFSLLITCISQCDYQPLILSHELCCHFNKFCFSSFFFVHSFIPCIGFFYLHLSHLHHHLHCYALSYFSFLPQFSSLVISALVICLPKENSAFGVY